MNAIIVAAGIGKRLKGFSDDRPKCMLEISGVSLFKRLTDLLLQSGISMINVVVGYRKEWFRDKSFRYFVNTDFENNDILHSLFYAEQAMDSGFLFSYSDIIYDRVIVRQMLNLEFDIAIAVDPNWEKHYEGRTGHPVDEAELVFSEDGKIVTSIKKNGDYSKACGEFIGVAYFSRQGARDLKLVFDDLKDFYSRNPEESFHTAKTFKKAYMTDMFQEMTNRGYPVHIITTKGSWAEIDTPQDFENMQKNFDEKTEMFGES